VWKRRSKGEHGARTGNRRGKTRPDLHQADLLNYKSYNSNPRIEIVEREWQLLPKTLSTCCSSPLLGNNTSKTLKGCMKKK
jgi:hypothetical protein